MNKIITLSLLFASINLINGMDQKVRIAACHALTTKYQLNRNLIKRIIFEADVATLRQQDLPDHEQIRKIYKIIGKIATKKKKLEDKDIYTINCLIESLGNKKCFTHSNILHESVKFYSEILERKDREKAQPAVTMSLIKMLVELGVSTTVSDFYRKTPLTIAVEHNKLDLVRYFLQHGAANPWIDSIDSGENRLVSPLHLAAREGYPEIVQALLEAGFNPNFEAREYWTGSPRANGTALHDAAATNQLETARILLEAGASLEMRDRYTLTPLELAQTEQMSDLLKSYKKPASSQ